MQNTDEKTKSKRKRIVKPLLCILFAVCVLLISFGGAFGIPDWQDVFVFAGVYADMDEGLSAGFVNVGTADACCIKCGDKQILIDSGTERLSSKLTDFLLRYKFGRFDAAVISHPDSDHFGGMADVIKDFGVDKIYMPNLPEKLVPDNAEYERFLNSVKEYNVTLIYPRSGDSITVGDMALDFISPDTVYNSRNDNSLVVKLCYGSHKFLFTGDISSKVEEDLLASQTNLDCDVLKAAHHGSKTSSCEEFLKAVSPEITVVSVGNGDSELPDYNTMARINSFSSTVYRTDTDNAVVITSDGESLKVHTDS